MNKKWEQHASTDPSITQQLSRELNIRTELASLLLQRGLDTFDKAKSFFRPQLSDLHDPFLMKDMHKAVDRLCEAVFKDERILVYGDYDVDGTTSVALVYSFLKEIVASNVSFYIPDRYAEGYGISKKGIDHAHDNNFSVVIALDCGIKALEQAKYARQKAIDLIICDHHLPGEKLPEAFAVLDPKRTDCKYPFKELPGCGVGFKLLQGFCLQNTIDLSKLFRYLDLVAVSIACDIVPIVGENRVLTFYGLKKINQRPLPAIKSLIEVSGLKSKLKISDLVFYLGPRINAAGRLAHASKAVDLLIADEQAVLDQFAKDLNDINGERKTQDTATTEEALEMIEEDGGVDRKSTVLFKSDWHKGIVGIVASRCIEKYYKPTIILTESKGEVTGSARSVEGFDVHGAIQACSELLNRFGGHHHAAGLTLPLENLEPFKKKFEKVVAERITEEQLYPKVEIDLEVPLSFASFKTLNIIQQMAPFGPGNLNPIFSSKNVKVQGNIRILGGKHLKMTLNQGTVARDAIAFNMEEKLPDIEGAHSIDIAYHIDENEYRGNKSLQLIVKDIKFAS